jgi:hypothetical protein
VATKQKAAADDKPAKKVKWPFPRATLEKALQIPLAIKEHNAGIHGTQKKYARRSVVRLGIPDFI